MAGDTTKIIVVAQAESGDVLQQGIVVEGADEAPIEAPVTIETTGEEHPEEHTAFPPFDSTYFGSQLIWLALTFIVLYVVMSRVALPRIGGILESRRVRIDGDLKEAERLRVETERALAAYEQALAEARANAQGIAFEVIGPNEIKNKYPFMEMDGIIGGLYDPFDGDIDPSFVITHTAPLDDAPDLYQKFRDKEDGCIKVVLKPHA